MLKTGLKFSLKSLNLGKFPLRSMSSRLEIFKSIGLSEQKAKETSKNENLAKHLEDIVVEARNRNGTTTIDKTTGMLLYSFATGNVKTPERMKMMVEYICSKKVASQAQLTAALDYLKAQPVDPVKIKEFETTCGVGVKVSPEEIEECIEKLVAENKEEIVKKRYTFNTGRIMGKAREQLKWADGKALKAELDMALLDLLGPKTEQDMAKPKAEKAPTKQQSGNKGSSPKAGSAKPVSKDVKIEEITLDDLGGEAAKFHKPGENYLTPGYVVTPKTMELLKEHLKETGGTGERWTGKK